MESADEFSLRHMRRRLRSAIDRVTRMGQWRDDALKGPLEQTRADLEAIDEAIGILLEGPPESDETPASKEVPV